MDVAGGGCCGAKLSLRGSPYWLLAGGWAIHPIWDVLLHYLGAGHAFAPEAWTIPCASFDLLVAAYIAITHRLGLTHRTGEGTRSVRPPGALNRPADPSRNPRRS
jgi:hypothetical protein